MKINVFAAVAGAFVLAGCAGPIGTYHYEFQFQSDPQGAVVSIVHPNGSTSAIGTTPVRRVMKVNESIPAQLQVELPLQFQWASGATQRGVWPWNPQKSKVAAFMGRRPAEAPHLEMDLRVAKAARQTQQDDDAAAIRAFLSGLAASQNQRGSSSVILHDAMSRPAAPAQGNAAVAPTPRIERSIEVIDPYTRQRYSGTVDATGSAAVRSEPGGPVYRGTLDAAGNGTLRDSSGREIRVRP